MEDCETDLLQEAGCRTTERIRSYRAAALTSAFFEVVRILYYSLLGAREEPEIWKKLHVGGLNGISCQHLQGMAAHLLHTHWEWQ